MIDAPKTRAEAQCYRYRVWAGSPNGSPYRPTLCAYEVPEGGRSLLFRQCGKSPGFGPDNLYCRQHANIIQSANTTTHHPMNTTKPKLTDAEINVLIAEACGVEKVTSNAGKFVAWAVNDRWSATPPNYCADLNAMAEAEKTLDGTAKGMVYEFEVRAVICRDAKIRFAPLTTVGGFRLITANPRQRAEAFLRTLGKWTE